MANNEFTIPIPARLKNVAKGGHVAGAEDIIDDALGKEQSVINQEVSEAIEGNTEAVAAERQRAVTAEGALDNRLSDVEELAEISIDGGEAKIATGEDFTNPTAEQRAKIPTVGAIVDGLNDGIYDVSKRNPTAGPNNDGKFTLEYILNNADTLIPTGWRHGGMSIKFVQSSDNKYVQYRLMAQNFTTDVTQWQGVDSKPSISNNLINGNGVVKSEDDVLGIVANDETTIQDFAFINTSYNSTTGEPLNYEMLTRSLIKDKIPVYNGCTIEIEIASGYKADLLLYSENGYIGRGSSPIVTRELAASFRLMVTKSDDTQNITPQEAYNAVTLNRTYQREKDVEFDGRIDFLEREQKKECFEEGKLQFFDKVNPNYVNAYVSGTGLYVSVPSSGFWSVIVPINISETKTITVHRATLTNRFGIASYANALPSNNEQALSYASGDNAYGLSISVPSNAKCIVVYFTKDTLSESDLETFANGLNVVIGEWSKYIPYYTAWGVYDALTKQVELPSWIGPTKPSYTAEEVHAIPNNLRVENYGKILGVGPTGNYVLLETAESFDANSDIVKYTSSNKVYVGADILNGVVPTLGTGWSGDQANGFTHVAGSESELSFPVTLTEGTAYLVEWTLSDVSAIYDLLLKLGNSAFVNTYCGNNSIKIGYIADGGNGLAFKIAANYATTILNLTCKPITNDVNDTEVVIYLYNNIVSDVNNDNITGFWNVGLGNKALSANQNASRNVAIGNEALSHLKYGRGNIALGTYALCYQEYGEYNIALGGDCAWEAHNAVFNIAIGKATMEKSNGSMFNVAIGHGVMSDTNPNNAFLENVVIGHLANTKGSNKSVFIGFAAGGGATGTGNVAIGHSAMSGASNGNNNICIGYGAKSLGGGESIAIGMNAQVSLSEQIAIGYGVVATESKQVAIGRSDSSLVLCGKKIKFNNDNTVTWEAIS